MATFVLFKDPYIQPPKDLQAESHMSALLQVDMPGLTFGQQDYHPYVFFKLNLNLLEK